MRPISVLLGAAGSSPWIPLNYLQESFAVGLAVVLSSGASLTYSVDHTFDDVSGFVTASLTRVTTTATLALPSHGLSVGDSVVVTGSGFSNLDGTFPVASVVDSNNITNTVTNSGATAANVQVSKLRVFTHETLTGLTSREDGNYAFPVKAIRLRISAYSSGFAQLLILQGV